MKYKNAKTVLPEKLIEEIQKYVQGEYLYIPISEKKEKEEPTEYKIELDKRNSHIYTKHLEGVSNHRLAKIYNLSESSIRRIIIRQKKDYAGMTDKITETLKLWNLQNCKVKQIYNSSWLIDNSYVLKVYNEADSLSRNITIINTLGKFGIPVGRVVPTIDGKEYIELGNSYCFLSEKLSGSNLTQIGYSKKYASIMGEIIADLHIAFKKCESEIEFWDNSMLDEMNGWIKENFEKSGWQLISKQDYEALVIKLSEIYNELPVQLIHRDVHFGNFLFDNGKFSGYIDFDLSQRNIRIFDLCYFLLSLLSEKEKFEITDELWYEFIRKTFAGYESKTTLSQTEKQAVPYVMECIELLFISYFASVEDNINALSAYNIFKFIKSNEKQILWAIR